MVPVMRPTFGVDECSCTRDNYQYKELAQFSKLEVVKVRSMVNWM
jgi:hypothetical protein